MGNMLNKEDPAALPEQIAGIIRQRIQSDFYIPGKKIDSIRKLSAELETSPVTVMKALDLLEKEDAVFRLPGKGVFVSKKFQLKNRPLTACYAFPEQTFREVRDSENRALNDEFYRGLLQGAMEENIKLQFAYFTTNPSPEQLSQQLKEIENYDFMILASYQYNLLMEKICHTLPVFCVRGSFTTQFPQGAHVSDYDRSDARKKLFQLFLNSRCRSAATLSAGNNVSARAKDFLHRVAEAGGITPRDGSWLFPIFDWNFDYDAALGRLKKLLSKEQPEFLFCDSTGLLSMIYEAAYSLKIQIGKELMVTGIASGMTVENLFPRYTYFKVPRYEQGVDIMHAAANCIRRGVPVDLPIHKVRLVAGESVDLRKN